jgi:HlyD family secretion protein
MKKTAIRWIKRAVGVLFVLAVLAMLVTAWMPKPVPVDTAGAERATLRVTVDEDGRTRVKDRHVISSPLVGNLGRIDLEPGDTVEEGDVVARIAPLAAPLLDERSRAQSEARVAGSNAAQRQASATISRIEAALAFAREDAQRQRQLAERGTVAEQVARRAELEARTLQEELASAQFAQRVAQHDAEMARAALGRLTGAARRGAQRGDAAEEEQLEIRAPVGGTVLKVMHESEGAVQPGTALLEIGDTSALEIVTDILTSDAVHVEPGARVIVDRWGGETPLNGVVRMVEPSAFTRVSALGVEEQRVNVVIDITDPHDVWMSLGDGYRVETSIVVWSEDDVLRVPASAVFRHGEGWAVYRADGGVAALTPIETGRRNGLAVQVLEGLEAGDRVIVHPSDRVTDGVEIEPR